MTVVLVHGNPETDAVWDPVVELLGRDDVVRLSPPGFGAPLPDGWPATYLDYRDWLERELNRFARPVDLVGHDWGGGHVLNLVMHRPELVRSWVSDVVGLFDPDYVWHDLAQVWQTPGDGEKLVDDMMGASLEEQAERLMGLDTGNRHQDGRRRGCGDGPRDLVSVPLGATAGHRAGRPGFGEGRRAAGVVSARDRGPLRRLGGNPAPSGRTRGRPDRGAGGPGPLVDGAGPGSQRSRSDPLLELARLAGPVAVPRFQRAAAAAEAA
jgi:pimeloyl-ACP methyl ester carboxylesterase